MLSTPSTPDERARRIVRQTLRAGSVDPGPYGDLCRSCLDDDRQATVRRMSQLTDGFRAAWDNLTLGVTAGAMQEMEAAARALGAAVYGHVTDVTDGKGQR